MRRDVDYEPVAAVVLQQLGGEGALVEDGRRQMIDGHGAVRGGGQVDRACDPSRPLGAPATVAQVLVAVIAQDVAVQADRGAHLDRVQDQPHARRAAHRRVDGEVLGVGVARAVPPLHLCRVLVVVAREGVGHLAGALEVGDEVARDGRGDVDGEAAQVGPRRAQAGP